VSRKADQDYLNKRGVGMISEIYELHNKFLYGDSCIGDQNAIFLTLHLFVIAVHIRTLIDIRK